MATSLVNVSRFYATSPPRSADCLSRYIRDQLKGEPPDSPGRRGHRVALRAEVLVTPEDDLRTLRPSGVITPSRVNAGVRSAVHLLRRWSLVRVIPAFCLLRSDHPLTNERP